MSFRRFRPGRAGSDAPAARHARAHRCRRLDRLRPTRARILWVGVACALFLVVLATVRNPLSDWLWPDTRIQQLRDEAALALERGRLTSADGRGAKELYQAALALDPDRADARDGLARVGRAAIGQARIAIAERRYGDARDSLALARELGVPRATVDAVTDILRAREAAGISIEYMLEQARVARSEGRLEGEGDSALELYQRALEIEPGEVRALEGREDTLADLVQRAHEQLRRDELAPAAALLERVRSADGGHADLPAALEALEQRLDAHRRRAALGLRRGRIERAAAAYRIVLEVRPTDPEAMRGLVQVANAYAARSERLAADFRIDASAAALREARSIAPQAPGIARAEARLTRARQSQLRLSGAALTPARRRELDRLLRAADAAERRGALLSPPGESAFDRLRAARAIAPGDPRVRRASTRLLPAAQRCFEAELQRNRLTRAGECLDAWQVLAARSGRIDDARRRLAQRWIAVGNERLGAGELAAAQAALAAARSLDAGAAGLEEFGQRLRAASAAR